VVERRLSAFILLIAGCGGGSAGVGPDSGGSQPPGDAGADSSAPDSAETDEAGLLPVETPLAPLPGAWTWHTVPGTSCDDGSPTGIAVNGGAADKLLIFFNGGGACWDAVTCYIVNSAVHGPFGQAQWDVQAPTAGAQGIFERTRTSNPFRDFSFVYVPYCTGDLHAGNNVVTYELAGQQKMYHHTGAANVKADLARIAAAWPGVKQVAITGSSAGGFGAMMNYAVVRARFPGATALLVDDAGPTLAADNIPASERAAWMSSWHIAELLDPVCPTCGDDLSALPVGVANKFPDDRMALVSSLQDSVIRGYFMLTPEAFQVSLLALKATRLDPLPGFRTFFVAGQTHTFLGNPAAARVGDVSLDAWLTQMVAGDPAWVSVSP
jgi:hypothetical protein